MSDDLTNSIREAIYPINDPHMGISIVEMGIVQSIDVDGDSAKIIIKPTNPACMSITRVAVQVKELAGKVEGVNNIEVIIVGHSMADTINEMVNR